MLSSVITEDSDIQISVIKQKHKYSDMVSVHNNTQTGVFFYWYKILVAIKRQNDKYYHSFQNS